MITWSKVWCGSTRRYEWKFEEYNHSILPINYSLPSYFFSMYSWHILDTEKEKFLILKQWYLLLIYLKLNDICFEHLYIVFGQRRLNREFLQACNFQELIGEDYTWRLHLLDLLEKITTVPVHAQELGCNATIFA